MFLDDLDDIFIAKLVLFADPLWLVLNGATPN